MKSMRKRNILIYWWMELATHLGKVSSTGDINKLYLLITPGQ